ncbi:UNVERIFIED_CONTAM: hypothetical protein ABID98_001854 [Brevibacillus sp. OAP136]
MIDFGNVSDIIFGISSGILTLVGLTSIFISINSQHNIQKAREIIWDLMNMPTKKLNKRDNDLFAKEIYHKILMYKDMTNDKGDLSKLILKISIVAIVSVCLMWLLLLIFLDQNNSAQKLFILICVICIVTIMLCFTLIISKLTNIKKTGKLPDYKDLLDVSINTNIDVLTLIGMSMELKITKNNNSEYIVYLAFPLPFENFYVSPTVSSKNVLTDEVDLILTPHDQYNGFVTFQKFTSWLNNPTMHYFELLKLELSVEKYRDIDVQINLSCNNGFTIVSYYDIELSDIDMSKSMFPDSCQRIWNETSEDLSPVKVKKSQHVTNKFITQLTKFIGKTLQIELSNGIIFTGDLENISSYPYGENDEDKWGCEFKIKNVIHNPEENSKIYEWKIFCLY